MANLTAAPARAQGRGGESGESGEGFSLPPMRIYNNQSFVSALTKTLPTLPTLPSPTVLVSTSPPVPLPVEIPNAVPDTGLTIAPMRAQCSTQCSAHCPPNGHSSKGASFHGASRISENAFRPRAAVLPYGPVPNAATGHWQLGKGIGARRHPLACV
jgi:hypothetical protein